MPTPFPSDLKRCFKCGVEKPRGQFYAHPQMGDGLLGKCKACAKRDMRVLRDENPDVHRDRDRKRWPRRKVAMKESGYIRSIDPETVRAARERWDLENRDKKKAHTTLNNAIRDGRVKKDPCYVCGSASSEGHHEDYSRPLAVVWLCPEHHGLWHRLKREVARVLASGGA